MTVPVSEKVRQRLKGPIRRMIRRTGYELVPRSRDESALLMRMIRDAGVTLLLDVGANQGQYADRMRAAGFEGDIVSFEPGREAFRLLARAAQCDPRWDVRRLAVGSEPGELMLNVSANSVSSSLLDIAGRHVQADGRSVTVDREVVRVVRLGDELPTTGRSTMVKVDAQGFDLPVLQGLGDLARQIELIQVELSLVELYAGQPTYLDVLHKLDDLGFTPCQVFPGFVDPVTEELLQFDVVARRRASRGH